MRLHSTGWVATSHLPSYSEHKKQKQKNNELNR